MSGVNTFSGYFVVFNSCFVYVEMLLSSFVLTYPIWQVVEEIIVFFQKWDELGSSFYQNMIHIISVISTHRPLANQDFVYLTPPPINNLIIFKISEIKLKYTEVLHTRILWEQLLHKRISMNYDIFLKSSRNIMHPEFSYKSVKFFLNFKVMHSPGWNKFYLKPAYLAMRLAFPNGWNLAQFQLYLYWIY